MLFLELLKKWAQTDRIAAVDPDGTSLSFLELEKRSDAIAKYWLNNLSEKSLVLIRGDKENDILSCIFAAIKSSHPYAFIPDNCPEERVKELVNQSHAELMVSLCKKPDYPLSIPVINQERLNEIVEKTDLFDCQFQPQPDDLACIFFTSGSTGKPKGVMITNDNLEWMEKWWTEATIRDMDAARVLNFAQYTYSASLGNIFCYMLRTGGTLFAVKRDTIKDINATTQLIFKISPTCFDCTPSFIDLCMQNDLFNYEHLPQLKMMSVGGELLTKPIAKKLFERFPNTRIVHGYGTTEISMGPIACDVTLDMISSDEQIPIGNTPEGTEAIVVDENKKEVELGKTGELAIVSDMVSIGYFNNPKKTEQNFFTAENGKRGYYTGDLVYMKKDGLIFYIGRLNNMVKISGYRVELEEIEIALSSLKNIEKSVVVPIFKDNRAVMTAAFIKRKETALSQSDLHEIIDIKKQLQRILPKYMIPSKYVFLDEFPRNSSDKIDRNALINQVRIN